MSIERHSRARQIDLGQSLVGRHKIYLDACFWIAVRDVALGVRVDPAACKLLYYLRRGVSNGTLVCPISAAMFLELMKQRYSLGRRIGTAQIIDELSLGVAMVPTHIVMETEIHGFLSRYSGGADLHPVQELIWTKVAYVLGNTYPSLAQLCPADELDLQKSFFDHLWSHSLIGIVKTIGDNFLEVDGYDKLSCETNEENGKRKVELRSFARTYDIELRGIVEIAGEIAADVMNEMTQNQTGHETPPSPEQRAGIVNMCRNLLYHAFKKPEVKDALRCIDIGASIHASMRWDKSRLFKPNDFYDFEHAIAALSYCDAFLTEGPLHDLVTRPHVNLEAVNGCRVFSNIDAGADYVRQLSAPVE